MRVKIIKHSVSHSDFGGIFLSPVGSWQHLCSFGLWEATSSNRFGFWPQARPWKLIPTVAYDSLLSKQFSLFLNKSWSEQPSARGLGGNFYLRNLKCNFEELLQIRWMWEHGPWSPVWKTSIPMGTLAFMQHLFSASVLTAAMTLHTNVWQTVKLTHHPREDCLVCPVVRPWTGLHNEIDRGWAQMVTTLILNTFILRLQRSKACNFSVCVGFQFKQAWHVLCRNRSSNSTCCSLRWGQLYSNRMVMDVPSSGWDSLHSLHSCWDTIVCQPPGKAMENKDPLADH